MAERAGGERIYVRVPRDFNELSDDERWSWARAVMARISNGSDGEATAP